MEAFTEWATSPSSITTYLEGEIVDFNIHSFKTSNLTSSLKEDATKWRKLEPFSQMTSEELVKNLVSRKFMSALTDEYVPYFTSLLPFLLLLQLLCDSSLKKWHIF
jgi:hypothetical protein